MRGEPSGSHYFGSALSRDGKELNVVGGKRARYIVESQTIIWKSRARGRRDGIQGQAEATVLAVGEKDDGLAAGASGKKLVRGQKNGLINIRATRIAKQFADADARDGLAYETPII